MNIFFTNNLSDRAAKNLRFYYRLHDKMILESTQLFFNAARTLGLRVPYKPFNPKHACVLWLLDSYDNITWLFEHLYSLGEHYYEYRNKYHKSFAVFDEWCTIDNLNAIYTAYKQLNKHELGLTLPYLAFTKGNEDLEQLYGTYKPNPNDKKKPYTIANSLDDAVIAYREYLRRKPYSQNKVLEFV